MQYQLKDISTECFTKYTSPHFLFPIVFDKKTKSIALNKLEFLLIHEGEEHFMK